jgi:hypothetical protein
MIGPLFWSTVTITLPFLQLGQRGLIETPLLPSDCPHLVILGSEPAKCTPKPGSNNPKPGSRESRLVDSLSILRE